VQTTKQRSMNGDKVYDLEERTARFGESIIDFAGTLPRNVVNNGLISQMVRSGTSIGANYMEADAAESKRDFRHKISICKKESKETKHWLRMIARANPEKKNECKKTLERGSGPDSDFFFHSVFDEESREGTSQKYWGTWQTERDFTGLDYGFWILALGFHLAFEL